MRLTHGNVFSLLKNSVQQIKETHEYTGIYIPNPKQCEVINCDKKRIIVVGGRKSGKTSGEVYRILRDYDYPSCITIVYTKTFEMLRDIWMTEFELQRKPGMHMSQLAKKIYLPHGGQVWLRHGGHYDSSTLARGVSHAHHIVFDEFAWLQPDLWTTVLPNAWVHDASVVFISSPWVGHFYKLVQFAEDEVLNNSNHPEYRLWQVFHRDSYDGTPCYLTEEEWKQRIDESKGSLSEIEWEREVLGKFVEQQGDVFKKVQMAFERGLGMHDYEKLPPSPPIDRPVAIGIDIGKQVDFTTVTATDENGNQWVLMRLNNPLGEWEFLADEVAKVISPLTLMSKPWHDDTGVGSIFGERLHKHNSTKFPDGIGTTSINFASKSINNRHRNKRTMVNNFQIAFELGNISVAKDEFGYSDIYNQELLAYTYKYREASDTIEYTHPPSEHDDTVDSGMLSWNNKLFNAHRIYSDEPPDEYEDEEAPLETANRKIFS